MKSFLCSKLTAMHIDTYINQASIYINNCERAFGICAVQI